MIDGRKDWEIHWSLRIQAIAWAVRQEDETWQRILGANRDQAIERAIEQANALVEEHGQPGTHALSVAAGSVAVLAAGGYAGTVNGVITTRIE